MMVICIYRNWYRRSLFSAAIKQWVQNANRTLSCIKINGGSQVLEFTGSAALIEVFSTPTMSLENTWKAHRTILSYKQLCWTTSHWNICQTCKQSIVNTSARTACKEGYNIIGKIICRHQDLSFYFDWFAIGAVAEIQIYQQHYNTNKLMDHGVSNKQPAIFSVAQYGKKSNIWIDILNHIVVESKLLGDIDLNGCKLGYVYDDGDVSLIWSQTFYAHKKNEKWTSIEYHGANTSVWWFDAACSDDRLSVTLMAHTELSFYLVVIPMNPSHHFSDHCRFVC